jgi:hypothetical protein
MNPNEPTLDERVEDYLDGLMGPREVRAFEQELTRPEVAQALHESLALRSMLAELPPAEVPDGLIERIERDLGIAESTPGRVRLPRLRAALSGAAWVFRGPAQIGSGSEDSLRAASIVSAPLTRLMTNDTPKPPLWRRVLKWGVS